MPQEQQHQPLVIGRLEQQQQPIDMHNRLFSQPDAPPLSHLHERISRGIPKPTYEADSNLNTNIL